MSYPLHPYHYDVRFSTRSEGHPALNGTSENYQLFVERASGANLESARIKAFTQMVRSFLQHRTWSDYPLSWPEIIHHGEVDSDSTPNSPHRILKGDNFRSLCRTLLLDLA